MKEIVLATRNPGKKSRYLRLLPFVPDLTVYSLEDFKGVQEPQEPFMTAEENARVKARGYFGQIKKPIMASDEALYVDFLSEEEQPGVHPRRILDREKRATDDEILDYWITKLQGRDGTAGGYWRHAFVFLSEERCIQKAVDRRFIFAKQPTHPLIPGYPMSSLCIDPVVGKTYAQMTEAEREDSDRRTLADIVTVSREFLCSICIH